MDFASEIHLFPGENLTAHGGFWLPNLGRETEPELVQLTVDGHIEPIIRMRWRGFGDVMPMVYDTHVW